MMTREELEKTPWAINMRETAPWAYDEAMELALSPNFAVMIISTNESGEWVYAVEALKNGKRTDFWMESYKSEKNAMALCERMGWRVVVE